MNVDFYGFHAGKYTSPMDGKGMIPVFIFFFRWVGSSVKDIHLDDSYLWGSGSLKKVSLPNMIIHRIQHPSKQIIISTQPAD